MNCPVCGIENLDDSQFCRKCATPLTGGAASFTRTIFEGRLELASGTVIAGHYKIDKVLGQGGMGIVYLAEDIKLKRSLALKFLPPRLMDSPELKERFLIEAQAAAALSHPNICVIHEVGEAEGRPFIAMEYVTGETLRDKLKKGPLATGDALDIATQIIAGLAEAHRKGIIHRDIKSANIMITEKGRAKIMDFGLAKVAGSTMVTKEGLTMGTVAYMSPEQARGDDVDQRTDIWSLGVILYEMLTGELPFKGDRDVSIIYSIVHEEPKSIKPRKPQVPFELQQVITRALKKNRDARYASAEEMAGDLGRYQENIRAEEAGFFNLRSLARRMKRPAYFFPAAAVLIAIAGGVYFLIQRNSHVRWARQVALPQVAKLIQENRFSPAYRLAKEAVKYIAKDPNLSDYLSQITASLTLVTDPPGAQVSIKDYAAPDEAFELLGVTPLDKAALPIGYKRWKIIKDGYEMVEVAGYILGIPVPNEIRIKLDAKGALPSDMVRIQPPPSYEFVPRLGSMGRLPAMKLANYLLDKHEVTNKRYKKFLDDGGYLRQEFWKQKFIHEGKEIRWEEAIKSFVDKTGRPGPATWELGNYPDGQDDIPVGGVSWYEAAAYAEYAGKSLPTVYHWRFAAGDQHVQGMLDAAYLIPLSNFGGKGPTPVGQTQGLSTEGVYDMAGNIKEWCMNEMEDGTRVILGGGWNEPSYMFGNLDRYPAWFRSPNFGFRCMKCLAESPMNAVTAQTIPLKPSPSLGDLKPCSDEVFKTYLKFFEYAKSPLNAKVEQKDDISRHTIFEEVSFDTAYAGERAGAFLFIPKEGKGPFQTVIHFPGSSVFDIKSIFDYGPKDWLDFHAKAGRAWVVPILKGTFGRQWTKEFRTKATYLEEAIMIFKDFMRTVDYLETRPEFDTTKLAYEGLSWGAINAPLAAAIDKRIRAIVMVGPVLDSVTEPQETHQINYAPRITAPVLIQTGRYDFLTSGTEVTKLLLGLFGTPAKDKHFKVYESGHAVWLLMEQKRDELDFLDKYLGPVKK